MDKFDASLSSTDDNIDIKEPSEDNTVVTTSSSRYKYILYIALFVIFILLIIWVIRVLFTNEPPLLVLNEMLNSALQIQASSD